MSKNAAIKAGRAEVYATIEDRLGPGLANMKRRLNSFAAGTAKIGGGLVASSAAALAPLGAAVVQFAKHGDEIQKTAARTGASAEALSQLKFAAEQSDASLQDLEKGFFGLRRSMFAAEKGSKAQTNALAAIGLTAADLAGMAPEDQLEKIADGLAGIDQTSRRGALAQKLFGGVAAKLLPLLSEGAAGIGKLRQEADRLGLTMSGADAKAAAEFSDAMNRLKSAAMATTLQIGAALAPTLTEASKIFSGIAGAVVNFARENRGLVRGLAIAAAAVGLVGGVLLAAAGGATLLSLAISGASAVIGAAGAVLAFILSPLGLIILAVASLTAALVAGIAWFVNFTDTGRAAWQALAIGASTAWSWLSALFGGIYAALAKGNWKLAAEIMWAGIKSVFLSSISFLTDKFGDFAKRLLSPLDDVIAGVNLISEKLTGEKALDFSVAAYVDAIKAGSKAAAEAQKKELADLIAEAQATEEKLEAEAKKPREPSPPPDLPEVAAATTTKNNARTIGSFNAAIVGSFRAIDTEKRDAARTAAAAEATVDILEEHTELLEGLEGELI